MDGLRPLLFLFTALGLYIGCSGVKFTQLPAGACLDFINRFGPEACRLTANGNREFSFTIVTGEVDILFVDDNSGSMYVEQEKMANQFPGFLDSLSKLDYQIAVVSTDVEGTGPLEDGRFIEFPGGELILSNKSRLKDARHFDNINKFQSTIKRPETLQCPNGAGCPSGDERGIFALNRTMDRKENAKLFRPTGHLAVVILSDEDERSSGGGAPGSEVNGGPISSNHLAEDYDRPETFINKFTQQVGPVKAVSVHSIIIRPAVTLDNGTQVAADTACFTQQNNQGGGVRGYYGTQYARLSQPNTALKALGNLVTGNLGSICSSNYTQEMGDIAAKLNQYSAETQLPCTPLDGTLSVGFESGPAPASAFVFDATTNRIRFTPALPPGTPANLRFVCGP